MLTDVDLEPMLRAVPAYAPTWAEERAGLDGAALNSPGVAWFFFDGLAHHLADRAAAGDFSEFAPMFVALDRMYADGAAAADMDTVLTTGFLESLIYSSQRNRVDPAGIARHVTGDNALAGWDAAYSYVCSDGKPR